MVSSPILKNKRSLESTNAILVLVPMLPTINTSKGHTSLQTCSLRGLAETMTVLKVVFEHMVYSARWREEAWEDNHRSAFVLLSSKEARMKQKTRTKKTKNDISLESRIC